MLLGMQQNTSMRLEQKLSPQMIQSVNLLQANTLELEQLVQQELLANPLLEMMDDYAQAEDSHEENYDGHDFEGDGDPEEGFAAPEDRAVDVDLDLVDSDFSETKDWDDRKEDLSHQDSPREGQDLSRNTVEETWEKSQTYGQSLEEFLEDQLHERRISDAIRERVILLINLLDDNGYLMPSPPDAPMNESSLDEASKKNLMEIEAMLRKQISLEECSQTLREAIHVLQSLEPAGIGARDLRECFLIQARRSNPISEYVIAILENHFEAFTQLEYAEIAKAINLTPAQVKQIFIEEISLLHRHPGQLVTGEPIQMKTAEMEVVRNENGEFLVRLADGTIPNVRISETYSKLLDDPHMGKEQKKWLREKQKSADFLLHSLKQREMTMLKVMRAIVAAQKEYFTPRWVQGPRGLRKEAGPLKPMILQTIAEEIGMAISTVNRVTNGKYVQTEFGIREIKEFFTAGVRQDDGSEVSSSSAKEAIRKLLENEPKDKPYSDDQIVKLLEQRDNLRLARRTVTKYREALGILSSRDRKKL